MSKTKFSDDFKRDAVLQITERGYPEFRSSGAARCQRAERSHEGAAREDFPRSKDQDASTCAVGRRYGGGGVVKSWTWSLIRTKT